MRFIQTFCGLFKLANHFKLHLQSFWSFTGLFLRTTQKMFVNLIYKVASEIHSNGTFKFIPFLKQNAMLCSSYFKFSGIDPNAANSLSMTEYWTHLLPFIVAVCL